MGGGELGAGGKGRGQKRVRGAGGAGEGSHRCNGLAPFVQLGLLRFLKSTK